MIALRRSIGLSALTVSLAAALTLAAASPAYAATVRGKSCGEKHAMSPDYYDAAGNAAPCTANFTTTGPSTIRITIQVVPHPGADRVNPHKWVVDVYTCDGTVQPGDPPRTFTCDVGPGRHTVFVDSTVSTQHTDLTVDY